MANLIQQQYTLSPDATGQRLDAVLAKLCPEFSRSRLQAWIKTGQIKVDGKMGRPRDRVKGDELIQIDATITDDLTWQPAALDLAILYEDDELLVINKPTGLVVHPGAGHTQQTLANALLHYAPQLAKLPRAGIVHRLDKNTSGLLVVAKTLMAQQGLVQQLQQHQVQRHYTAIVNGVMISGGTINKPLGRDPKQRQRRAVILNGKPAITHYRVSERFRAHTRLKVQLETGRTHQIRVHCATIGYPLLGDRTYGARPILPPHASDTLKSTIQNYAFQALHARRLIFTHPLTNASLTFTAPLPAMLQALIILLRANTHAL